MLLSAIVFCCVAMFNGATARLGYVAFDLQAMQNSFLESIDNQAPVFNSTYDDIYRKLYEFAILNYGIEDVLSKSSLYAQIIPPYAISKQQSDRQSVSLPAIIKSTNTKDGSYVVYLTTPQWITFQSALSGFSQAHVTAIQGIVGMIRTAENVVEDPRYKFTKAHMEIPDSLESESTGGLADFLSGNQGLVDGLQTIVDIGSEAVMNQQDNPLSSYFVESMFTYYSSALNVYQRIVKDIKLMKTQVETEASQSMTVYKIKIKDDVDQMIAHATTFAGLFQSLNFICTAFHHKIMHPDPQSIVISRENANGGVS